MAGNRFCYSGSANLVLSTELASESRAVLVLTWDYSFLSFGKCTSQGIGDFRIETNTDFRSGTPS